MDIRHDLVINATPETIYNAVATHAGINGWWSKECTVGEKVGENSVLNFDKQGTMVRMDFRTEELAPNKRVVWACTKNANSMWENTKIITEIGEKKEGGVEVVFNHAGFDDSCAGQEGFEMTKQGWDHFVGSLVAFCETGNGQPW